MTTPQDMRTLMESIAGITESFNNNDRVQVKAEHFADFAEEQAYYDGQVDQEEYDDWMGRLKNDNEFYVIDHDKYLEVDWNGDELHATPDFFEPYTGDSQVAETETSEPKRNRAYYTKKIAADLGATAGKIKKDLNLLATANEIFADHLKADMEAGIITPKQYDSRRKKKLFEPPEHTQKGQPRQWMR